MPPVDSGSVLCHGPVGIPQRALLLLKRPPRRNLRPAREIFKPASVVVQSTPWMGNPMSANEASSDKSSAAGASNYSSSAAQNVDSQPGAPRLTTKLFLTLSFEHMCTEPTET